MKRTPAELAALRTELVMYARAVWGKQLEHYEVGAIEAIIGTNCTTKKGAAKKLREHFALPRITEKE